jgi:SAM-dependent methyltransferase
MRREEFGIDDAKTALVSGSHRALGRRFDAERGVVTQALLFLGELDADAIGEAMAHATHYEPVPIPDFHALLDEVPLDVIRRSTFVDVGSGLGRAVLLAMERPFKQIVGVEVSAALHETARENLRNARGFEPLCRDVRLVCGDARGFSYPPGDLIAFLFNPFDDVALRDTLARIAARDSPGETWLLYHTPARAALTIDGFECIATFGFGFVARWG